MGAPRYAAILEKAELAVAGIAGAIGEPARARMLFCLMDGHARTSTELSVVGGVSPSTASAHLSRLTAERLVQVHTQGKCRYYSLTGSHVADALEGLIVLAGVSRDTFVPRTPPRLRFARTCYDHMAGSVAVALHDRLHTLQWLAAPSQHGDTAYSITPEGAHAFAVLGVDIDSLQKLRRRFAYACLDWSERRPHIGGALGAAILTIALRRNWFEQDLDSRILTLTNSGRRALNMKFGLAL